MNIIVTVSYVETPDFDLRMRQVTELLLNSYRNPESPICQELEPEHERESGNRISNLHDIGDPVSG